MFSLKPKPKVIFILFVAVALMAVFGLWAQPSFAQTFTRSNNSNFATSPEDCPLSNSAGTVECAAGQYFVNGACRTSTTVASAVQACLTNSQNTVFRCSNNSCVCPSGTRDCRGTSGTIGGARCLNAAGISTVDSLGATCTNQSRSFNSCTGACVGCTGGFEEVDGVCLSLAQVNTRVTGVDDRVTGVDDRVTGVDDRVGTVDDRVTEVSDDVTAVDNRVAVLDAETTTQLTAGQTRLTAFLNVLEKVLPAGDILTALTDVITGDDLAADFARLNTLLEDLATITVQRAAIADTVPDDAITSVKIANGTIVSADLSATAGITAGQIADGTLTTADLSSTAGITSAQIANGAIQLTDLGMTCATNEILQLASSGSWGCGSLPTDPVFVGLSATIPNGNLTGYLNANDRCSDGIGLTGAAQAAVLRSHVCSAQEIINTYVNAEANLDGISGVAWINNGPPGYIENVVNDCSGWWSESSTIFGSIWNFTNNSASITPCDRASLPLACCR